MNEWWNNLTQLNQAFYGGAAFFSVFFVWQLISAFMGLDTDSDAEVDVDADAGDGDQAYDDFDDGTESDAGETTMAFKLLSVRSIVTFFTLFAWGGALYLNRGDAPARAMGLSAIWGLAGMLSVALFFFLLPKLAHTGTKSLKTAVGTQGSVYLNIPENGSGEIRVTVSGHMSHVRARGAGGKAFGAGARVRVVRQLDQTTVEVAALDEGEKGEQV